MAICAFVLVLLLYFSAALSSCCRMPVWQHMERWCVRHVPRPWLMKYKANGNIKQHRWPLSFTEVNGEVVEGLVFGGILHIQELGASHQGRLMLKEDAGFTELKIGFRREVHLPLVPTQHSIMCRESCRDWALQFGLFLTTSCFYENNKIRSTLGLHVSAAQR